MSAPKHPMTARVVSRDPNVWQVKCGRHATFTASTYAEAEDKWREHVHAELGFAPKPLGDKSVPRWEPTT